MPTLHIAPGDSAGGSLLRAIREAGQDDEVLPFRDDLSCGPIASDEPSARAIWWGQFYEVSEVEAALREFWDRVQSTDDRLVVWFSRHSASELAFFLAWADRLGDRPYEIVDVTGQRLPYRGRDGSLTLSRPAQSVSILQPDALKSLFGTKTAVSTKEKDKSRREWRRLRTENAPFRVVTASDLVSAPIDYFDASLLAQAGIGWQNSNRIVANAMAYNSEPYFQVHDLMLRARLVALVDEGRLISDGDPWDRSARIRLPG